jgi:hypothetical protein
MGGAKSGFIYAAARAIQRFGLTYYAHAPRSVPGVFALRFGATNRTETPRLAFPIRPDRPLKFRLRRVRENDTGAPTITIVRPATDCEIRPGS